MAERQLLLPIDVAAPPSATALARALLFVFAAGIPADVLLSSRIGNASFVLGVPLVVAGVWQVVHSRAFRTLPPTLLILVAFTAWAAVSVVWSRDAPSLEIRTRTNAQLLLFVVLGWQILRSRRDVRAALSGFVVGCTLAAAETWRTFVGTGPSEDVSRYVADEFDPNDLAVTLSVGIPMVAYLALGERRLSRLWLAYVPLAVTAIVLTGSRGGTVTAVVAVAAVALWLARQSRVALVSTLGALAIGIAVASATVPAETWTRIFTIREQLAGGTMGDRTPIWRAGFALLDRHSLVGVGAGGFPHAVAPVLFRRFAAHNTLLSVGVELGAIGFVLFAGTFASIVASAARAARKDRALARNLVVTWIVGSASLSWEYRKTTWFVLLVGAALAGLRTAAERRAREPARAVGVPVAPRA